MTTRLTDEQIAELERLEREAWVAPWVAHTFEIDCPCPNGEDCGDAHTCEEVEAPEAYPASPEAPAAPGDGQCVVQIAVPGLESLAGPTAAFIAAARNALPALLAEVRASRAASAPTPEPRCKVCGDSGYVTTDPTEPTPECQSCDYWERRCSCPPADPCHCGRRGAPAPTPSGPEGHAHDPDPRDEVLSNLLLRAKWANLLLRAKWAEEDGRDNVEVSLFGVRSLVAEIRRLRSLSPRGSGSGTKGGA